MSYRKHISYDQSTINTAIVTRDDASTLTGGDLLLVYIAAEDILKSVDLANLVSEGGGGEFASGTRLLFQQTTAPTGWTRVSSFPDNSIIKAQTGTVSTYSGGSPFTTVFSAKSVAGTFTVSPATLPTTSGAHAITVPEMPSHSHLSGVRADGTVPFYPAMGGPTNVVSVPNPLAPTGSALNTGPTNAGLTYNSSLTGSGSPHTHTVPSQPHNHSAPFTGGPINNFDIKYLDIIVAEKD